MVFHEISSIKDVIRSHRIIIYYIQGKSKYICKNDRSVFRNTETALELLKKKNDDLLLAKISHGSEQFKQFIDLYQPEATGTITLFAVNNEGIPLLSELIYEDINIFSAIESLATVCKLNAVPLAHLNKLIKSVEIQVEHIQLNGNNSEGFGTPFEEKERADSLSSVSTNGEKKPEELHHLFTRLQIRLPNGGKEEEKFPRDAMLQEVWILISTKYNIRDFDLKTYYHPIFNEDDYNKTLQSLDLCPSGVIIVVNKNISPLNNSGGISAIVQSSISRFMSSTTLAFQYIQALLFSFWRYIYHSDNTSDARTQRQKTTKLSNDNSVDQSSSQSTARPRRFVPKNVGSNIHTLHRSDDSDDENSRYNGNSTQQK